MPRVSPDLPSPNRRNDAATPSTRYPRRSPMLNPSIRSRVARSTEDPQASRRRRRSPLSEANRTAQWYPGRHQLNRAKETVSSRGGIQQPKRDDGPATPGSAAPVAIPSPAAQDHSSSVPEECIFLPHGQSPTAAEDMEATGEADGVGPFLSTRQSWWQAWNGPNSGSDCTLVNWATWTYGRRWLVNQFTRKFQWNVGSWDER